jgi:DNA-binding NarL/FixJ family response regulator
MKTVLIVDDHPSFRASARALLEADGYEVVGEAEDGFSAIEATTALGPDIVLLDIQLPDLDGFEVAERIVRNGRPCAIVLTSSRDSSEYGSLVADSAARGFVSKAELSGPAIELLIG